MQSCSSWSSAWIWNLLYSVTSVSRVSNIHLPRPRKGHSDLAPGLKAECPAVDGLRTIARCTGGTLKESVGNCSSRN